MSAFGRSFGRRFPPRIGAGSGGGSVEPPPPPPPTGVSGLVALAHDMDRMGVDGGGARSLDDYKKKNHQAYEAGLTATVKYWDSYSQPSANWWQSGQTYAVGDFVVAAYPNSRTPFNATDFECIQAHTANSGNAPESTPSTPGGANAYWRPSCLVYEQELRAIDEDIAAGIPTAKFVWGFRGAQDTVGVDTEFLDAIIRNKNRPAVLRDALNRPYVSGYFNVFDATHLAYLSAAGCPIAYYPDQAYANGQGSYMVPAAQAGALGYFPFYPFGNEFKDTFPGIGGVASMSSWIPYSNARLAEAASLNIKFMPVIIPHYQGSLDHATEPNGSRFEANGLLGLRDQLNWAIGNNCNAQVLTWNDFKESSELQSYGNAGAAYPNGYNKSNWTSYTLIDKSGYRHFMRPYFQRLTSGTTPAITQEEVIVCHKCHPVTAAAFANLTSGEKTFLVNTYLDPSVTSAAIGGGPYEFATMWAQQIAHNQVFTDYAHVCVRLLAPATVTISLGVSVVTQDCPAGETILEIRGATSLGNGKFCFSSAQMGFLNVLMQRGATTVFSGASPMEVTPYIIPANFRPFCKRLYLGP